MKCGHRCVAGVLPTRTFPIYTPSPLPFHFPFFVHHPVKDSANFLGYFQSSFPIRLPPELPAPSSFPFLLLCPSLCKRLNIFFGHFQESFPIRLPPQLHTPTPLLARSRPFSTSARTTFFSCATISSGACPSLRTLFSAAESSSSSPSSSL